MPWRRMLLAAAVKASEVENSFGIRQHIEDGFCRVNPAKISEIAGVTLLYRPLEHLLGAFINEGTPGIMVNVDRPRGLINMTCAHELGHYFLNHTTSFDSKIDYDRNASIIEQQADSFAYSLLMPKWLVIKQMEIKNWDTVSLKNPMVVYQLSLRLGVSFTAMAWTLARLNFFPVDAAKKMTRISPQSLKQLLLSGTQIENYTKDVWLLDSADRNSIIEPAVGDILMLDLPNYTAGGYIWSVDDAVSEGFNLQPVLEEASLQSQSFSDDTIVGGEQTLRFQLQTLKPTEVKPHERVSFTLEDKRPWEKNSTHEVLHFSTEFVELSMGASHFNKQTRVQNQIGLNRT